MHGAWKVSFALATLGAFARPLAAADAVPVESVAPASGLGAAREELNTVKGARQADDAKPGATAVEMPKLHQAGDADPMPRRRPNAGRGERPEIAPKGSNWLLDGVAREKALAEKAARSPRDLRDRDRPPRSSQVVTGDPDTAGREGEPALDPTALGSSTAATAEPGTVTALAASTEPPERIEPPATPVANPLADFLSDWLSPGDHDLLRSTLGPAESPGGSREGFGPTAIDSANPVIAGLADRNRFQGGAGESKPAENPFLAFLQPPETSAGPSPVTVAPPPAMPREPLPAPPQFEPPPTRSRTPDFVRPLQDEKYYKPLKRF